MLLNKGADPYAKDIYGFVPIDYADQNFDQKARDVVLNFINKVIERDKFYFERMANCSKVQNDLD